MVNKKNLSYNQVQSYFIQNTTFIGVPLCVPIFSLPPVGVCYCVVLPIRLLCCSAYIQLANCMCPMQLLPLVMLLYI